MKTVKTLGGNAYTFLTHLFGRGLEDERYAVERFQSMDDGDIRARTASGGAAGGGTRPVVSRRTRRGAL